MSTIKPFARNAITSLVIVLQVCAFPLVAYAEDSPANGNTATTTPPATAQTVMPTPAPSPAPSPAPAPAPAPVQSAPPTQTTTKKTVPAPTGYKLNPATGNYENDKYIWDPNTFQTTPKTDPKYSYNPVTGVWETAKYAYDPAAGSYAPNIPAASSTAAPSAINSPTGTSAVPSMDSARLLGSNVAGANKSPDPTNFFSGFYNAQISNNIYSTARSGDASVTQNTVGGNALSGNASSMANLLNILQTSFNPGGSGNVGTFVANIDGNVVGDITIDPGKISNTPLGVTNGQKNSNLEVNVENNGSITNNVNLDATSGNSKVSGNTQAGNATTGNATAIANVVNMINSSVAAGQSFFGILNINGNFNGDVLLPPNALDYLLASSAPKTTVAVPTQNLTANLTNNQTINNNVNATANSGTATVSHNTQAGNATTGNASTDVTILNLTGSNIVASNSLLVFVNVLGKWVGLIVNAPAGSNSAAYAGGVKSNTPIPGYKNADVNATNNSTITNNINVAAKSGNAEATDNTQAGNAKSGNATATVNLANIMNSNLSLSNWFGVLFINVFGTWNGSFGVNTAAGNPVSTTGSHQNTAGLMNFIPEGAKNTGTGSNTYYFGPSSFDNSLPVATADFFGDLEINSNNKSKAVLASAISKGKSSTPGTTPGATPSKGYINWDTAAASLLLLGAAIGAERMLALMRSRRGAEVAIHR